MIEILAPAGDVASAYAAINNGADAVYLGLTCFSARSSAENFDELALKNLIKHAHLFNVKVYVAMNTLVKQKELSMFVSSAVSVWNYGVDAIILQDIFIGKLLKERYPDIVLHLSTQAGTNNSYGAKLAKDYGFSRVILARETPLEQIERITKIIETEVFVQGALCTCFSGQCYLSSFAGGNSGNRGRCKQPCRKLYKLTANGVERETNYAISLSDLCVGDNINALIKAGVSSFKIEGRMRRPEYVAAAVRYYRGLIDGVDVKQEVSDLKRAYNRGNYTKGLAFGQDKSFISSEVQGHIGEFVGVIKVINGKFVCYTEANIEVGDGFKVLRCGKEICGAICVGKDKRSIILQSKYRLKNGDKAFITTDKSLSEKLLFNKRLLPLSVDIIIKKDALPYTIIEDKILYGDEIVQTAKNRPLSAQDVIKCFEKTDMYPFSVNIKNIDIDDDIFIPISKLNDFRRKVYCEYYNELTQNNNTLYEYNESEWGFFTCKKGLINKKIAIIANDLRGLKCDVAILKPCDYSKDFQKLMEGYEGEKYLYLPAYATDKFLSDIKGRLSDFDGVYCEGFYGVLYAEDINKKLFVGFGFNVSNNQAIEILDTKAEYICLSKELIKEEATALSSCNTFYLTCGDIKVMDIIYCPFGKKCSTCKVGELSFLEDDAKRIFTLKRYKSDACRFELYNCSTLIAENDFTGRVFDCSITDTSIVNDYFHGIDKLKEKIENYTSGHSRSPVI